MVAAAVPFALAPGLVDDDQVLDYSTTDGKKLYKSATAALPHEFDCEQANLTLFLAEVDFRADEFSWEEALTIPEQHNNAASPKHHLIKEYGLVTLKQVHNYAKTYLGEEARLAQDDAQLFHCLMASLTTEGKNKILLQKSDWILKDEEGKAHKSGAALLKVIIRESHIDTNATVLSIREDLSKLDQHMIDLSSDIQKFNDHVTSQIEALAARGEKTLDILAHLFKGYESASDQTFRNYIQDKKNDYQEGKPMSYRTLMNLALTKYQVLVQEKKWNAPTETEEKLVALRAELKAKNEQLKAKIKQFEKKRKRGSGNKDADKSKNGDDGPKEKKNKPAWMTTAPQKGAPKTKNVNGKVYHWCDKHEAWTRHKPSKCKGKGHIPNKKRVSFDDDKDKEHKEKAAMNKVAKALSALQEDDSDEE